MTTANQSQNPVEIRGGALARSAGFSFAGERIMADCDYDDLSEEDQYKLASYDLLEFDCRFAARRLCRVLQNYQGELPEGAANALRGILDEFLMCHLLPQDHEWLGEMVKKLEAP